MRFFILFMITLILASCGTKNNSLYEKQINDWHKEREDNLKEPDGWLSLTGLVWIEKDNNKFGNAPDMDLVFPKENTLPYMGEISFEENKWIIKPAKDAELKINNKTFNSAELLADTSGTPTVVEYKSVQFYLIVRGNKTGVRIKDSLSTTRLNFTGINRFSVDSTWKVPAVFIAYAKPRILEVPSVLGGVNKEYSPGHLTFQIDEELCSLDVLAAGDNYFVIFGDYTNGEKTYGAGRFLLVPVADDKGNTYIDFNKAYNPPCAFTKYATCPLPPANNRLKVAVTAGEKAYGEGHH